MAFFLRLRLASIIMDHILPGLVTAAMEQELDHNLRYIFHNYTLDYLNTLQLTLLQCTISTTRWSHNILLEIFHEKNSLLGLGIEPITF